MPNITQAGKGFSFEFIPTLLPYYTRIFTVKTKLFIPPSYNGDLFLGAIDRYHKVGQIFFLLDGYVVKQSFLQYLQEDWGTFIFHRDVDLPIFIEQDGISLGEIPDPSKKHLTPNTLYSPSNIIGRFNLGAMLKDFIFDSLLDLAEYELLQTIKSYAKYKPGLYNQMAVVDQICIECFRDDVLIELNVEGLR